MLIIKIEENVHGYVLSSSVSNLDFFKKHFNSIKHFWLNEYIFSIFIHLNSEMINCLMELAIPN